MNIDKSKYIRYIDFEISSICNAGCSVCMRRSYGHFTEFEQTYWSYEEVVRCIDIEIISNLISLQFCGNFGDAMGNPDVVKITEYFKKHNKNLSVYVKTNGGIGDYKLYKEMARLGAIFTFGIDGIGEKNELYRVNVKWDNLYKNLKTFSEYCTSNQLEIQFLLWNETTDQLIPIIELIQEIGFGTLYIRKPYTTGIKTEVFNMKSESTHFLTEVKDVRLNKYLDSKWEYKNLNLLKQEIINLKLTPPLVEMSNYKIYPTQKKYKKVYTTAYLETSEKYEKKCQTCYSKNFKNPIDLNGEDYNIYITHNKLLMPCCYIPPNISNQMFYSTGNETYEQKEILNSMSEIGFENFSLNKKTLKEVFNSYILHIFIYNKLMDGKEFKMCNSICGI